jgi:hypothetical protein
MGEMIRLYYAANLRLWRARESGSITEADFRARQKAIDLWLGERGSITNHRGMPSPEAACRSSTRSIRPRHGTRKGTRTGYRRRYDL